MQQDPIAFQAGDCDLYRYTFNDPIDATDITGLREAPMDVEPEQFSGSQIASGFQVHIDSATISSVTITSISATGSVVVSLALTTVPNATIADHIKDFVNNNLPFDFTSVPPGMQIDMTKKTDLSGKTWRLNMTNLPIYVPPGNPFYDNSSPFTITISGVIVLSVKQGWIAPAVPIPAPATPPMPGPPPQGNAFWRFLRWLIQKDYYGEPYPK